MFKIKNFKIEFKHLLTAVSAIGMVAGFIVALCGKKKTAACAGFFASFAGLIAGLGMEAGVVPQPACCEKLEIVLDDEPVDDEPEEEIAPEKVAEDAE